MDGTGMDVSSGVEPTPRRCVATQNQVPCLSVLSAKSVVPTADSRFRAPARLCHGTAGRCPGLSWVAPLGLKRPGPKEEGIPPFACSLFFCGDSPSAPLRLCARPSSFRSEHGTGSSRAEALGRRGNETRHSRLLCGFAALPLLSVREGNGRKRPRSLKATKGGTDAGESRGSERGLTASRS